ncbi:MAG: flippase-like domain-containing protein [Kineosporiaceae bacterium]|nr:flippase-like domain-containing protein [Kineosporiaceae bacterium]
MATVLGVWVLISQREQALEAISHLRWQHLVIALVAGVGTVLCSAMIWRTVLADLGDRLPLVSAGEIFLLGQLGKYLPGSVWPMLMQAQIGSRHGVSKRRTVATSVITLLISIAAGSLLIAVTWPLRPDVGGGTRWLAVLVVPAVAVLYPPVLQRVLDAGLRAVRREPLGSRTTLRGTASAAAWSLLGWCCSGALVLALAVPLGLPWGLDSAALAFGGYALAWLAGLIVVIAPAGAGAREGALVAVLATALPTAAGLVVALVARLMFTVADLLLAALVVIVVRRTGD